MNEKFDAWRPGETRFSGRYQLVVGSSSNGHVCEVQAPLIDGKVDNEGREKIARLIAAAPDLLEACQGALALLAPFDDPGLSLGLGEQALQPLRAAIAKAYGAS